MKKNKFIITIGVLLLNVTINAQEISVYYNAGLQGLEHTVKNGNSKLKYGNKLGINYTYFLNSNWGIISGLEFSTFQNRVYLNDQTNKSFQVDDDGDAFEYRVQTRGYKEQSKFHGISIPLMAQFRTSGTTQFYLNTGVRVTFPFNQKSTVTIDELKLSGYYSDLNVELTDMPNHGFGTIENWKGESETKLKTTFSLSGETGISFKLSEKIRLYTGVYLDYGLNNIHKVSNNALIDYDNMNLSNSPNSVLQSSEYVKKSNLLAYGVQVKLGFGNSKQKQKYENRENEIRAEEAVVNEVYSISEQEVFNERSSESSIKKIPQNFIEEVSQPIIFKDLGNKNISLNVQNHLDNVANVLKEYSSYHVLIVGHTCNIGSTAKNDEVGRERAKNVAKYLEDKGITPDRIVIESKGESQPKFSNNTNENREKNRRVEITVVE